MDLQRAKELLSGLADGVDPLMGEILPEDLQKRLARRKQLRI